MSSYLRSQILVLLLPELVVLWRVDLDVSKRRHLVEDFAEPVPPLHVPEPVAESVACYGMRSLRERRDVISSRAFPRLFFIRHRLPLFLG